MLQGTTERCVGCVGREPDVLEANEIAWSVFQSTMEIEFSPMSGTPMGIKWAPVLWLLDKLNLEYPADALWRIKAVSSAAVSAIQEKMPTTGGNDDGTGTGK